MKRKFIYLISAIALLILRLIFNFSYELIPGINGGYYPLQVRSLLETGRLGFPDMPLYFYLNAAVVKIIAFFIPADLNLLIIHSNKIIDAISLPLIIIPLYLIIQNFSKNKLPLNLETGIILFSTLSFAPLILTSDLQKNAAAIPFMLFFIYFLIRFYENNTRKYFLSAGVFILLCGLTHFGVFLIVLLFVIISLIVFYRRKALLPVIGIAAAGILLVYLFDAHRAVRLFDLWDILFQNPLILQGPLPHLDLFNYLFSYLLIGLSLFYVFYRKNDSLTFAKNMLIVFSVLLFILSFPLLDTGYSKRFNLFLFIPQTMIILFLNPFIKQKTKTALSIILVLSSITAVFSMTMRLKPPIISQQAFQDLANIEEYITEPRNTLIIARHGLEWWTAWQLHVKVAQDIAVNRETFQNYQNIFSLIQLKGQNQIHPFQKNPFHEPFYPKERKPVYRSLYFMLVRLSADDLRLKD